MKERKGLESKIAENLTKVGSIGIDVNFLLFYKYVFKDINHRFQKTFQWTECTVKSFHKLNSTSVQQLYVFKKNINMIYIYFISFVEKCSVVRIEVLTQSKHGEKCTQVHHEAALIDDLFSFMW